jgi:ATP-dependent Clp protease ATP-binding subunit ClpA
MATGETLDLRNNVVVATSNIGSRMLMESRSTDRDNFGASNQPGRAVSSTFKPNYSRLILARWQGIRRY